MGAFKSATIDASNRDDRITDAQIWVNKTGAGWAYALAFILVVAAIVMFFTGRVAAGVACLAAPIVQTLIGQLRRGEKGAD